MTALSSYDWPGNIRELQNVLLRYLTMGRLDFMNADRRTQANEAFAMPHNRKGVIVITAPVGKKR